MKPDYEFTCCICGQHIKGEWGNNPFPVVNAGECCDKCNYSVVIPARLNTLNINHYDKASRKLY